MERRDYKSTKQDRYRNITTPTTRENPSFSSTLLDSIYKSIDEKIRDYNSTEPEPEFVKYRETMRKKQINTSTNKSVNSSNEEELANLKRACLIEKWMEKKKTSTENIVVPRPKSMPVIDLRRTTTFLNSSSSSNSDSSFSGGLSSSETESIYAMNSSNFNNIKKPKPIRTSVSSGNTREIEQNRENSSSRNNFAKTKLRALKIYSDLKKVKQPISPGGRLTSFLNSLFANGNSKKTKLSVNSEKIKSNSAYYSSTCSSTSSFSRSCLSKTPSSAAGKTLNGIAKRSVKFDDDFGFIAVKNMRNVQANESDHVAVVVNKYETNNGDFGMKNVPEAAFDDDDDDMSCASSDLFELDNLATIGIDRYSEELPVYETTHFGMNVAISKGVFV